MRETYTGVASGAFDDRATGFQEAALFGIFDDVEGGAVFDAAAWVLELGLSEDGTGGFGGELVEFYEGCVANCFELSAQVYRGRLKTSRKLDQVYFRASQRRTSSKTVYHPLGFGDANAVRINALAAPTIGIGCFCSRCAPGTRGQPAHSGA